MPSISCTCPIHFVTSQNVSGERIYYMLKNVTGIEISDKNSKLLLPEAEYMLQRCKWMLCKSSIEEGNGKNEACNKRKSCFS